MRLTREVKTWDEQDITSHWRKLLCRYSRAGAVKVVKRTYNKRERRAAKQQDYTIDY